MNEISVIIDCSGSMTCMSKKDIVQSVCRDLYLHEGFEFKFYAWSDIVKEIYAEKDRIEIDFGGRNSLEGLVQFIRNKLGSAGDILLLTDGFIDEDKNEFTTLIRDSHNLKFRVIGIGADWNEGRISALFPQNFVVTSSDKKHFIFSPLDMEAALESFYEK